jgi:hypothetical protein
MFNEEKMIRELMKVLLLMVFALTTALVLGGCNNANTESNQDKFGAIQDGAAGLAMMKKEEKASGDEVVVKLPPLREYVENIMEDCASQYNLSPAMRSVRVDQIIRVMNTNLKGLAPYAFIGALCLETRVGKLPNPKSHAGATGIGQLMFQTAKTEAVRCGYGEIKPEDLQDNELNLLIATCHFQALVDEHGLAIAPLAYNSGGGSDAVQKAKRLMPSQNLETMGYGAIVGVILTRYILEGKNQAPKKVVAIESKDTVQQTP